MTPVLDSCTNGPQAAEPTIPLHLSSAPVIAPVIAIAVWRTYTETSKSTKLISNQKPLVFVPCNESIDQISSCDTEEESEQSTTFSFVYWESNKTPATRRTRDEEDVNNASRVCRRNGMEGEATGKLRAPLDQPTPGSSVNDTKTNSLPQP